MEMGGRDPSAHYSIGLNAIELESLVNVLAGQWHTVSAMESGSVLLECNDGKYEPLEPEDILGL